MKKAKKSLKLVKKQVEVLTPNQLRQIAGGTMAAGGLQSQEI